MSHYLKLGLAGVLLFSLWMVSSGQETHPLFVDVEVKGVRLDPTGQNPLVLLVDKAGKRALPIWIGFLEASAIERELTSVAAPRPMTHDLFHTVLGLTNVKVKEVKITQMKEHTYYALLFLVTEKGAIEVDARPSDAVVLALKSKAPISVSATLLDQQGLPLPTPATLGERHGLRVQELTPLLASQFNFKGSKGVLVAEVISGSPADASGFMAGDIITQIGVKAVGNIQEFGAAFEPLPGAESIQVSIFREGQFSEVRMTLRP